MKFEEWWQGNLNTETYWSQGKTWARAAWDHQQAIIDELKNDIKELIELGTDQIVCEKLNRLQKENEILRSRAKSIASKFKSASKAFWNIVTLYNFSREEQATLLGIKHNRERLKQLQDHNQIPEADDVLLRVGMLVAIHKNLRIIFPYNTDIVYKWMKRENPDFGGLSPIHYISAGEMGQGLNRFAAVRRRLDQVRCNGY